MSHKSFLSADTPPPHTLSPTPPLSQVLSVRNAVFDLWRRQPGGGGNLTGLGVYMMDNLHPHRSVMLIATGELHSTVVPNVLDTSVPSWSRRLGHLIWADVVICAFQVGA